MNILEKSKEYAQGKAMEAMTAAIEQAFEVGYNEGYKAGLQARDSLSELETNGVEYVDLGLPSGTLWSSGYLKDDEGNIVYLPYVEAAKKNIPTKEQFEELKKVCKLMPIFNNANMWCGVIIIGANGKTIKLHFAYTSKGGILENRQSCKFWLKTDSEPEDGEIERAYITPERIFTSALFKGYGIPVMLVR